MTDPIALGPALKSGPMVIQVMKGERSSTPVMSSGGARAGAERGLIPRDISGAVGAEHGLRGHVTCPSAF